jgi:hypothetical protein
MNRVDIQRKIEEKVKELPNRNDVILEIENKTGKKLGLRVDNFDEVEFSIVEDSNDIRHELGEEILYVGLDLKEGDN